MRGSIRLAAPCRCVPVNSDVRPHVARHAAISQLNAQLSRARIAKWDFEEARSYLEAMRGRRLHVLRRALLTSAVVAYCRPFTQNEMPGAAAKATPALAVRLNRLYDGQELEVHKKLLALRHEALAHSAYARKPVGRVGGSMRGFTLAGRPFDVLSQNLNYTLLAGMCKKLETHCESKMSELNRQILRVESARPNPSIERTSPGMPVAASHVER